nr:hypothetical protein [uncultured Haemophilus sp.]
MNALQSQVQQQLKKQFAFLDDPNISGTSTQDNMEKIYGNPKIQRLSAKEREANLEAFNTNLTENARQTGQAFMQNTAGRPIEEHYEMQKEAQNAFKAQLSHLSEEQQQLALDTFNAETDVLKQADDGAGVIARTGDLLSYIPSTATKFGEQLTGLFSPDGDWRKWFTDATKEVESWRSDESKLRNYINAQNLAQAKANGESGFTQYLANAVNAPLETIGQFAESAIPTIASGVIGAAAAPVTGGASLALPFAIGGVQGAGETRNNIYDHIMAMPETQLAQSPEYQALLAQGLSPAQARNELASSLTEHGGEILATGVSSAILNKLGGLGRIGQAGKGVLGSTTGKFVSEAVTEPVDEVFQQLMGNKAIHDIDPTHSLSDGLGEAAAGGLLFGVADGGVAATDNAFRTENTAAKAEEPVVNPESPKQTEQQAEQTTTPINSQALDEALKPYQDSEDYAEMRADLERDIQDGVIEERAKSNSQYGKLAQAYLNATGQAQGQNQATTEPEQAVENPQNVATQDQAEAELQQTAEPQSVEENAELEDTPRFSLNESSDSPFAKAVDTVVNGGQTTGKYIAMGTTPDVLKMLGLPDANIRISDEVIHKVMSKYLSFPKGNRPNIHNLSPEVLKQLPTQLNNPVAVFNSSTRENALCGFNRII